MNVGHLKLKGFLKVNITVVNKLISKGKASIFRSAFVINNFAPDSWLSNGYRAAVYSKTLQKLHECLIFCNLSNEPSDN